MAAGAGGARTHRETPAHPQSGQGIVEYALIFALSAVVTIVVLVFLGPTLADVLEVIGKAIDAASRSN
ncbi:MAG: Flp family type IVb pilin [Chloroflexi bacterium]|nr:MAG: Flp family type IVb pilin [Chloroflexota bacterium]